jgi:hypothetical protein
MGKRYTDTIDVNLQISLYDYGVIRNPKNNRTIICRNFGDEEAINVIFPEKSFKPDLISMDISIEDVIEALTEIEQDFFDFIGYSGTRNHYILNLDKSHLSSEINSLMMYGGNILSDSISEY